MEECTDLLLKYREMVCRIWNDAFWPNPDLKTGDCFLVGDYVGAFAEATARLYEGMVLLPLGHEQRVQDWNDPGLGGPVTIRVNAPDVEWLRDPNLPGEPSHAWTPTRVPLHPDGCALEFLSFFGWDQLGRQDLPFVKVLVRRLDALPEAEGRWALIPVPAVTAWAPPPPKPSC